MNDVYVDDPIDTVLREGFTALQRADPKLFRLVAEERRRQEITLSMVASSSAAPKSVLVCAGSVLSNTTTEGYPGMRFHAGCEVVDEVERLAIQRAKTAFGAQYANVQPHSGSSANEAVLFALLATGDTLLSMRLDAGGHLTHGSVASFAGRHYSVVSYGLRRELIDYRQVAVLAKKHRPRLMICGASSYPRLIDFVRFREIADSVGAYLLADISHIAGLVVSGEHESPIDVAHVTTTSTYKQLYGPRGGLILMGREAETIGAGKTTLRARMQQAVFPGIQGTPDMASIAAKARALAAITEPSFTARMRRVVVCAKEIAKGFRRRGFHVVSGGTDTHMVLIRVADKGLTGFIAEKALESVGILVNRNLVPDDPEPPRIASGVRVGANTLALRGFGQTESRLAVDLIVDVLRAIRPMGDQDFDLDEDVQHRVATEVRRLCDEFPLPYDAAGAG